MNDSNGQLPPSVALQGKVGMGVRRTVAAARKLRRTSSDVERKLWHRIRDKQLEGYRFRRQRTIDKYIVDFMCLDAKLIVELDDGQHAEGAAYDEKQTAFLESLGFRVLRFWNIEVIENIEGVLERIRGELLRRQAPTPPSALPLAGEGTDDTGGTLIALAPSPAEPGEERGVRDARVAPAERLDDAAASAPCKGAEMEVPTQKEEHQADAREKK